MKTNSFINQLLNFSLTLSDVVWTEDDTESMYSELLNIWISTLSDDEIIDALNGNVEEMNTIDILKSLNKNGHLSVFVSWVFQRALGV